MNFFKSVFADEENPESDPQSAPEPDPEPEDQPTAPTWGFVGGLIKTITTRSESVIETYKRDLQEFSSGLKLETQVLKEVASSSLEVGASKAQESLESVGQAIDNIGSVVWKSTSQIITNPNLGSINDSDLENPVVSSLSANNIHSKSIYSRFDVQLRGIQGDVNTYVEGVEDVGEFEKWKSGFDLGEKEEEIEGLLRENVVIDGIYKRVVPSVVDHDVFWLRYFYRVHKLGQAESVRAKLVERANEDEELSWDVDDEEEEVDGNDNVEEEKEKEKAKDMNESSEVAQEGGNEEEGKKKNGDEKTPSEGSKDSDLTVVSTQPSRGEEEEDLGWDEIEDIGSDDDDDKKGKETEGSGAGGSPSNREELRKRLSVAEDDEDLSWDIEDDDEPMKKS